MKVAKENEKKPLSQKSSAKSEQSSADSAGRGSQKKKKAKAPEMKLGRKVRQMYTCIIETADRRARNVWASARYVSAVLAVYLTLLKSVSPRWHRMVNCQKLNEAMLLLTP